MPEVDEETKPNMTFGMTEVQGLDDTSKLEEKEEEESDDSDNEESDKDGDDEEEKEAEQEPPPAKKVPIIK